ncbi:MAG: hypothetical protein COV52_04405 [Gammaproteobacteria bacterium CG11_big_fil_rev_8_21_14_0_20_46_22]|nr:MAG: hypothetical protein COV52_04405 [Gammaproteobacteria bacterium CG11_big_fil_rev_8_21_14_0_20_46_22]
MFLNNEISEKLHKLTDLYKYDALFHSLICEEWRDELTLNLCAYDNILSKSARYFLQSQLGFRYRLGEIAKAPVNADYQQKGSLLYTEKPALTQLETKAYDVAVKIFSGIGADFRPLSGVHATMCSVLALTSVNEVVYSIDPGDGGHFATRGVVEMSGRKSVYMPWDRERQDVDFNRLREMLNESKPTLIILEHGCPQRPLNIKRLRETVGDSVFIAYDASHTLGLMAGGLFQSPLLEGCDLLQANTHKSFPGPQKALYIFANSLVQERLSSALDDALVSSQHTHNLMALCISMLEMELWGKEYAIKMLENSAALKNELLKLGFNVLYPNDHSTHIILIEFKDEFSGKAFFQRLLASGIATNFRLMRDKAVIRLGTQELTRKGFEPYQMVYIADLMARANEGERGSHGVASEVSELMRNSNEVHYSFDDNLSINRLIQGNYDASQH